MFGRGCPALIISYTDFFNFGLTFPGTMTSPLLKLIFFEANSAIVPADFPRAIKNTFSYFLRSISEFENLILFFKMCFVREREEFDIRRPSFMIEIIVR